MPLGAVGAGGPIAAAAPVGRAPGGAGGALVVVGVVGGATALAAAAAAGIGGGGFVASGAEGGASGARRQFVAALPGRAPEVAAPRLLRVTVACVGQAGTADSQPEAAAPVSADRRLIAPQRPQNSCCWPALAVRGQIVASPRRVVAGESPQRGLRPPNRCQAPRCLMAPGGEIGEPRLDLHADAGSVLCGPAELADDGGLSIGQLWLSG